MPAEKTRRHMNYDPIYLLSAISLALLLIVGAEGFFIVRLYHTVGETQDAYKVLYQKYLQVNQAKIDLEAERITFEKQREELASFISASRMSQSLCEEAISKLMDKVESLELP